MQIDSTAAGRWNEYFGGGIEYALHVFFDRYLPPSIVSQARSGTLSIDVPAPYIDYTAQIKFSDPSGLYPNFPYFVFVALSVSGGPTVGSTDPEPYSFGGNPADFSTGETFLSLGMSFAYTLVCNQSDFHCGRADRFDYGGLPSDTVALTFHETLTGPYAEYGPATIYIEAPVDIRWLRPSPNHPLGR